MKRELVSKAELQRATGVSESELQHYMSRLLVTRPARIGRGRGRGFDIGWPRRAVGEIRRVRDLLKKGVSLREQAAAVSSQKKQGRQNWSFRGSPPKYSLSPPDAVRRIRACGVRIAAQDIEEILVELIMAGIIPATLTGEGTVRNLEFEHNARADEVLQDIADIMDRLSYPEVNGVGACFLFYQVKRESQKQAAERAEDLLYTEGDERMAVERELKHSDQTNWRLSRVIDGLVQRLNEGPRKTTRKR
jgi:DNA-binding transcriptional MerR regulator